MSTESWPPQLKYDLPSDLNKSSLSSRDWVAKCLSQMTESNRTEAQAELRKVIADAYAAKTLWTTDWPGIQLQSLSKPLPNFNNLKRKINEAPHVQKKSKKSAVKIPSNFDPNDQAALTRRTQRFQRDQELERQKNSVGMNGGQASLKANYRNTHLFNNRIPRPNSPSPFDMNVDEPEADPNVPNWDRFTIVGTNQQIFKDYLRLTSEPKPETIRPYPVLQQTLIELKKRWREKAPYNWICSQLKSIRQDLTVQRIKNEFTIQVYEMHARVALETGDMVEYNQCQAALKGLYELGIPGGRVEEFTAYRILMLIHGRNKSELNLFVSQLTPKQKADPAVQHALNVQRAMSMGNYHALFELYDNAPHMGAYIMDHFIERERVKALMIVTKAYMTLPLSFIHRELAFDSITQARDFLINNSAAFFTNPNSPDAERILNCKPAYPCLVQTYEEKFRKVNIKGAI